MDLSEWPVFMHLLLSLFHIFAMKGMWEGAFFFQLFRWILAGRDPTAEVSSAGMTWCIPTSKTLAEEAIDVILM